MSDERPLEEAGSPKGGGPLAPALRSAEDRGILAWVVPLLAVADLVLLPRWPLLALLAVGLVLLPRARRALPTLQGALTIALLLLPFAVRAHLAVEASAAGSAEERQRNAIERRVQQRWSALVTRMTALAEQVALLPAARSVPRDPQGLAALFASLEQLAARDAGIERLPVALAVHSHALVPLAWSGRATDLAPLRAGLQSGPAVFVRTGAASTVVLATAPIPAGGGPLAGYATVEVAVRGSAGRPGRSGDERDWLLDGARGARILYRDARQASFSPRDTPSTVRALRSPTGEILAVLDVTPAGTKERERALWNRYRGLAAVLIVTLFLLQSFRHPTPRQLSLGTTATRLALGALAVHAAAPLSLTDWRQLDLAVLVAPLLASPLDRLLTALWLTVLSLALVTRALREDIAARPLWRTVLGDVLALGLVALTFACVGLTVERSSPNVEPPPLLPTSASGTLLHATLLLELIAGAGLAVFLLARAHPRMRRGWPLLLRIAAWLGLGYLAGHFWPRPALGLPLVPAVGFLALVALAAELHDLAVFRRRSASTSGRVRVTMAVGGLLALLVYPTLVHYSEKRLRRRVERAFAPMVLDQARWRGETLSRSCRQLDGLAPLERFPAEPVPAEELAFALWSRTDLAEFGFSSAIEVQGPSGDVVSRFGQNLAWLGLPLDLLPSSAAWEIAPARLTVGSATRAVLHASRLVRARDQVLGALHVYVADDHWNLPFLIGRNPYSLVARGAPQDDLGGLPVSLVCYRLDGAVHFASVERPPLLTEALVARARTQPEGFWTTLQVDGQAQRVFLFQDSAGFYALGYPRLGVARFAANLLETTIALLLLAGIALLIVTTARAIIDRRAPSLAGVYRRVRGTFSLRLGVAFVALAVVPVLALGVAVRAFVGDRLRREAENQALERAAVARKAVLDFALFQGERPRPEQPVTDAALVWIASLVRNDLDLFTHGRLLASSKRELYASGLVAPRIQGSVYRALALDNRPYVFHTESIGELVHQVVSIPLRLDSAESGVLSVPLASRERETAAALADVDRGIRLSLLLFVLCAIVLGHSMARRISDPISALTRATHRIAEGDLSPRVTPTSHDELRSLVEAFNRMAADLTAQRAELERTHRLAAFAEMARQVAHEVKNPLTPIQLSAEHLRRVIDDPSVDFRATLDSCTGTILRQVRTLRGIVTEFSAFGQPHPARLEPLDLAEVAREVLRPYQAVLPPEVTLSLTTAPVPPVRGDRRLIERALVNLVENALQAVGSVGRIGVEVGARPDRRHVQVVIADSGPGLAPEARSRLFEPFFSTKEGGTGLGLALVRKIVEEHGGDVRLESDPARGTRATLSLPASGPGDDPGRGPHA